MSCCNVKKTAYVRNFETVDILSHLHQSVILLLCHCVFVSICQPVNHITDMDAICVISDSTGSREK